MDICNGIGNEGYQGCVNNVEIAVSAVYETVLKRAVDEEKEANAMHGYPENHFTVSGDGTWKKRGFSSLFGVSTLIGYNSKKVVDAVVKSSYCRACSNHKALKNEDIAEFETWYKSHKENCTSNHEGSAGKMEIDGIVKMFERSEEKHGVKYVKYVGDGHSKTFKGIITRKIYGDDVNGQKKECMGHVEKTDGDKAEKCEKSK